MAAMEKEMAAMKKAYLTMEKELERLNDLVGGETEKPEVEACKGKEVKDSCWFETPGGDKKKGYCVGKAPLWCKATDGPGIPKPEPKPEVEACKGKENDDSCWFKAPGGKKKGFCVGNKFTELWCKAATDSPEPPKPEVEACEGKEEEDPCHFETEGGEKKKGSCVGQDPLWCQALTKPKPKPEVQACRHLRKGLSCHYVLPGSHWEHKGKCVGDDVVWCKADFFCVGGKYKSRCWHLSSIEVCKGKEIEDDCSYKPTVGDKAGKDRTGKCVEPDTNKLIGPGGKKLPVFCSTAPGVKPEFAACEKKKNGSTCWLTTGG